MSTNKYEVHATVAVTPYEGFTAEGWLKMHKTSFKNRKVEKVGTKGKATVFTVVLEPMVNGALADLMKPYKDSTKWTQVAEVEVVHYWRQAVIA